MKIEIEFEEVEALRKQIATKDEQIEKLTNYLQSLDSDTLKKQAVDLSKIMFHDYMESVFRHLGFKDNGKQLRSKRDSIVFEDNIEHWLGKSWYDSDRLTVNLGANISKHWRRAFLRLGIKTTPTNN